MTNPPTPQVYSYDAAHARILAPLMDSAAKEVESLFEIPFHVEKATKESGNALPSELVVELWQIVEYRLDEDDRGSVRLQPISDPDSVLPRAMDQASADVRRLWEDCADVVTTPMLVAHFADLLLSAKIRNGPSHAGATIDAYLDLSTSTTAEHLHVVEGLMRASTIARVYKLTSHEERTRERMYVLAGKFLADSDPLAGLVLRLLETLSRPPATAAFTSPTAGEVGDLLDKAHVVFDGNFSIDSIARIALNLAANDSERSAARSRQVSSYIALADASEGPVRMLHLNTAAQLADQHHLHQLRDDAVRKMQAMNREEMQWNVTEVSIPIPGQSVRAWLRPLRKAADWREGLQLWLTTASPSGSYATNLAEAKKAANSPGLLKIFPTIVFGSHGMPQKSYPALRDDEQRRLVELEAHTLQLYGRLHWAILDAIRDKFGKPDVQEVAAFLVTAYKCDTGLAEVVAVALDSFWEGQFTAASHIAYPSIEAGARAVLLLLDEPMYRVEKAKSPGRFPALDFYLDALERHGFDRDWDRAIRSLLLSDGSNLRNLAAHGFRRLFSGEEAAVLIRLAAMFATIAPANSSGFDRKTVAAFVRRPLKASRRNLKPRLGIVWR